MATGSQNLTTYYAKRIIGDASAASSSAALLQTGIGVTADTWILNRTNRATDYGIIYNYDYVNDTTGDADKIEFVGKGVVTAWVRLDTGDFYVAGKVGIGYNPNTSGNTYKLYVDGTTYFNNNVRHNGFVYFADGSTYYVNNSGTANLYGLTVNSSATFKAGVLIRNNKNWPMIVFQGNNNTKDMGYFTITRSDPGDGDLYNASHHEFVVYSYNNSTKARLDYRELYALPTVTADLTADKSYSILTTKNTVTVGQGGTGRATLTANAILYGNGTSAIGMLASANGAVYATSANGALSFGTLPTGQGGTGNTSYTANRLVWTESATKLVAGYHYASSTKVGICYTSEPSYNFAVSGTSYFNGNTTHNGIDYFANGTTYYINNSGDSRLRYEYANTHTVYDAAGFISSTAGSPWPYIRFDTRAGGSTYVTTAQTNWCELYVQLPAKRASDNYYYKTRFFFRQYSKTANTTTRIGYYEDYYLPETNDGRTANAGYNILTSKDLSFSITGNAATATALTSNAGGTEQPIYFTGGKPSATSYALKATVNNSTAGYFAYYSGARAVSGTSNARLTDGCLNLYPSSGSYREGLRIYPTGSWSTIVLGGNDLSATSGTSANSWSIHNNNGNFYISRNASSAGRNLRCVDNVWSVGNKSNNASYAEAAFQIREEGYGGAGSDTWGRAPRLAWHWSGRVAAQIGLASNGYLYTAPLTGTNFYRLVYESGSWGISVTGSSGSCTGNAATATRINGTLGNATSSVARNIWVSSTNSADGIPNYISSFYMNPSTKEFGVPSGTRIYPQTGALYLGNSGNQSWVYVQDMASQASGTPWKLTQAGALTCVSGTLTGQLYINYDQDVGLNQNGSLVIGTKTSTNIGIDSNEIMARSNGAASTLYLNSEGGLVYIGGGGLTVTGVLSPGKIEIKPAVHEWAMQVGGDRWGGTGILNGTADNTGNGSGNLSIASWYGIIFEDGTNWTTKAGINCRTGVYYGKGFSNTSSILVKENIKSLSEDKARQILLTRPVSFDYKKEFSGMKGQFGLIAEELEEILPELVEQPTDKKGYKHIDYTRIIPFLIKLAQSQQKEIDELKHQIKYLIN